MKQQRLEPLQYTWHTVALTLSQSAMHKTTATTNLYTTGGIQPDRHCQKCLFCKLLVRSAPANVSGRRGPASREPPRASRAFFTYSLIS